MQSTGLLNAASARVPAILALVFVLSSSTVAEARLFWQTYGSTVPTADGCGCSWNTNQDYFVPRHSSSCRYDLFSPCKTSCTTSPACKWSHPLYPGYCGIYGPCHYARRDHVYQARCGCTPLKLGPCVGRCKAKRAGQCQANCSAPTYGGYPEMMAVAELRPLPNVEAPGLEVLGSIPVEGNAMFVSDLEDDFEGNKLLLSPQPILPKRLLPSLGRSQTDNLTLPLPTN